MFSHIWADEQLISKLFSAACAGPHQDLIFLRIYCRSLNK